MHEFSTIYFNPSSTTRRYKRHQNKVRVKGLGGKSSYLVGFLNFFFCKVLWKNSISRLKKNTFLSSIKTKVDITFSKKKIIFLFFLMKIGLARKGLIYTCKHAYYG